MSTQNLSYANPVGSGVTITLTSLASDTNLLAGRESASISNTGVGTQYPDYYASALITAGQGPTVSTNIELWVAAIMAVTGATTVWPDTLAGTDANRTLSSLNTKYNALAQAAVLTIDAFPNRSYNVKPFSIAQLFGNICPTQFSFFVVHNTAVVLSPTGTKQGIWVTPVTWTMT